jgi:hypothetical protein
LEELRAAAEEGEESGGSDARGGGGGGGDGATMMASINDIYDKMDGLFNTMVRACASILPPPLYLPNILLHSVHRPFSTVYTFIRISVHLLLTIYLSSSNYLFNSPSLYQTSQEKENKELRAELASTAKRLEKTSSEGREVGLRHCFPSCLFFVIINHTSPHHFTYSPIHLSPSPPHITRRRSRAWRGS